MTNDLFDLEPPTCYRVMDLRPTPAAYRHTLQIIVAGGAVEDKRWAIAEAERVAEVGHWWDDNGPQPDTYLIGAIQRCANPFVDPRG